MRIYLGTSIILLAVVLAPFADTWPDRLGLISAAYADLSDYAGYFEQSARYVAIKTRNSSRFNPQELNEDDYLQMARHCKKNLEALKQFEKVSASEMPSYVEFTAQDELRFTRLLTETYNQFQPSIKSCYENMNRSYCQAMIRLATCTSTTVQTLQKLRTEGYPIYSDQWERGKDWEAGKNWVLGEKTFAPNGLQLSVGVGR